MRSSLEVWYKRSYVYKILAATLLLNLLGISMVVNRQAFRIALGGDRVVAKDPKRAVVRNRDHLAIDTRSDPEEAVVFENISRDIPYLPIEDLNNIHYKNRNLNHSCAWYPSFRDIQIHNDYWQEFHNRNITYYLFGAYLDNRPSVVYDHPMVRVLTMIHFIAANASDYPPTYCQLWYKEKPEPVITLASDLRRIWYYDWGHGPEHNYAHLLGCPVSEEHKKWIPKTVSLVVSPCDKATNNVKVFYQPLKEDEQKKGFAVCVKGLDYPYVDVSHRLVEYVETLRSLGAEKIMMYNLQVHPNTTKVLKYYEETGFLEYRPFSLSLEVSNLNEYRHMEMAKNGFAYILHEVVPYNDCLYRNMYLYKYVAVIDVDEILMPLGKYSNWSQLMEYGEKITNPNCKHFASYCFRCIYFPQYAEKPVYSKDIPPYFYMMQHVHRVKEHIRPQWATKCLHNTERVIATHNHFPIQWIWDVCPSFSFESADAQLQHYREPPLKDTLDDPVVDTSLWRFKDDVIERSMKVFEDLSFFKEVSYDD
ncbi:uncharacterized protein LOC106084205 [Stomoxys calcitrans]|uniref:uncharacterized protein LOC106084205 n=1 Tax=Stomoxys calcitrans TaxID=35570 RepID=UPI0027E37CBB|nr:uncharacterized protein LOC106084205 [Stomoxys calcitrans]